jgi:hypothetical protein
MSGNEPNRRSTPFARALHPAARIRVRSSNSYRTWEPLARHYQRIDPRDLSPEIGAGGTYRKSICTRSLNLRHRIAVIKAIIGAFPDDNDHMSSTDAARMRQKTQRLEIPDKAVSTSTVEFGGGRLP